MMKNLSLWLAGVAVFGILIFVLNNYLHPEISEVTISDNIDDTAQEFDEELEDKSDLIRVTSPASGATVANPITVTGKARGYWFFEASFPIDVVNWDGLIIGAGFATADGEWMTEEFVPFSGTIEYDLPADTPYKRGAIIFKKDNPSGLPEHDDAIEIPIVFGELDK